MEEKKNITLKIFEFFENIGLWILEKIFLKKIADFYREHLEGMRYLVCGALATVVNIVVYSIFFYLIHLENSLSNVIAWVIAAIFAYITNKFIVFETTLDTKGKLVKEIISFFSCRLFTLAIDEAMMIITVDKLGINAFLMKVLANIIVIIVNYIFSKVLIFKKTKEN